MSRVIVFYFLLCFSYASASDLDILLKLKDSLGASAASSNGFGSWSRSNSPCEFSGIACDSTENVTEIDISNRGISGEVPFRSICQLPQLTKLALGSNNLRGVLPADVRTCTNLRHLDLASNRFTGEVPDLSSLTKLQVLNLSDNGFTGALPSYFLGNLTDLVALLLGDNTFDVSPFPVEVLGLTKLNWLYLSNCSISGSIPPKIGDLTGLINLELSTNKLSGGIPSEITKLTRLWQLELYDNHLTGKLPEGLGNLKNLELFDASNNFLEGNLSEIRFLTNLTWLQLYRNNFSGDVPPEIGEFKKLVNLSLYGNKLTGELPPRLGSWSEFNFIDVSTNMLTGRIPSDMCKKGTMTKLLMLQNRFYGEIPATYGNCTTLVRFRVNENSLSGKVPEGIWSLPKVNVLDLKMNRFSGSVGVGLGKAKWLTEITISQNQFSGELPNEISGADKLVAIDARSNKLSGHIPESIGKLKRLNSLILEGNDIGGEIPASLGSCLSLNEVNLAGNFLSGTIPATLGKLPVLNSLNLSHNQLTGKIPASLSSLKLSSLDLSHNRLTGEVPPALAIGAYDQSFLGNPGLCGDGVSFLRQCPSGSNKSPDRFRTILACLFAFLGVLLASVGIFHFVKRRRASKRNDNDLEVQKFISNDAWKMKSFRVLTFDEKEILNGIRRENLIGKGGSGNVYKVVLRSGTTMAVKHIWNQPSPTMLAGTKGGGTSYEPMLSRKGSKVSREFEAEVGTLSSIRHVNVVKLYCSITSEDSSLLVYEYLPNGSLWDRLHGDCGGNGLKGGREGLDWETRYDVAVGAAKGLEYLHHGCSRMILHRDVKSSNILLDEFFKPRIADFGLAKILQGVGGKDEYSRILAGTHGYIAPEYAYTWKVNEKSDVYSFGIVLMELVTGKKPIEMEFGENKDIIHWMHSKMTCREETLSLLDPVISKDMEEEAMKVLKVGVLCTVRLPALRPSMRVVVQMLEEAGRWRSSAFAAEATVGGKVDVAVVEYGSLEGSKMEKS